MFFAETPPDLLVSTADTTHPTKPRNYNRVPGIPAHIHHRRGRGTRRRIAVPAPTWRRRILERHRRNHRGREVALLSLCVLARRRGGALESYHCAEVIYLAGRQGRRRPGEGRSTRGAATWRSRAHHAGAPRSHAAEGEARRPKTHHRRQLVATIAIENLQEKSD